jgi:hypothetical protein
MISFFRLRLVLYACVQTFNVMGDGKKNLGTKPDVGLCVPVVETE